MQFSKVIKAVTTQSSNGDKHDSYAKGKTGQERKTKPSESKYDYIQAANATSDDEELKTSIPCSDDLPGDYEYFDANPSTSDASDNSILRRLPASGLNPENVQLLFECREKDCRAATTAQTLGYCGTHFLQRFREDRIRIPTGDDICQFRENRRSFDLYVPRPDDDDIIESFNNVSVQPSKTCFAPMCYKPSERGNGRFCTECLSIMESQSIKSEALPPQRKRLRCPGCNGHGLVTYNGLCGDCYTILCKAHAEQTPTPKPDAEHSSAATHRSDRRPVKPHSKTVKPRHLQRHLQNMRYERSRSETPPNLRRSARRTQSASTSRPCSKSQLHTGSGNLDECCMNRGRSHARHPNGLHLEDTHDDYVMVEPQRSIPAELSYTADPHLRNCRSESCNNYGNEKSNGYCNVCFNSFTVYY